MSRKKYKDKVVEVNRYNKKAFMPENGNLFLGGGDTDDLKNPAKKQGFFSQYGSTLLKAAPGIASGIASAYSDEGPQYSPEAAGNGFGLVDTALANGNKSEEGTALVNTGASLMDQGLFLPGGILGTVGTVWNALAGINENKANVKAIKSNTASLRNTGKIINQASNTSDLSTLASLMGTGSGFKWNDLYTNGLLTNKGTAKGNDLINKENAAWRYQNYNFGNAVAKVDQNQDDLVKTKATFGLGGDIDNSGMSVIDYDIKKDFLNMMAEKNKANQKVPTNPFGSVMNPITTFGKGGKIHIKPSHRGRLTKLKKRTGKTEAELYNDGNPAHKRMVVFARNARRWNKHADGGPVEVNDNTRVYNPIFPPIERQSNFSDSEYFWGSGPQYPSGLWRQKDGSFSATRPENGERIVLTQEEADNIIRANNIKNRKERLRKIMEEKKPVTFLNNEGSLFALGGVVQSHGGDWSTGASLIDAGGSHEENPNQGIQFGTDSEGTPNLVEEGEVVYNDYVYSQRIPCDEETKKLFHISKKRNITYADLARKLAKEAEEHENDPLTQAALKVQMQDLADSQEKQKQEMEAARAREAFEALSPEQQMALMAQAQQQDQAQQEAAMQEQLAQEQAMQEQAMAQQGISPEEAAMAEQMMQAEGAPMVETAPQMSAYGGEINRFDDGGSLKEKIYKLLKKSTDREFEDWVKKQGTESHGLSYDTLLDLLNKGDLETLRKNDLFWDALAKENPALRHALNNTYDFGLYKPDDSDKITIKSIAKGNWRDRLYKGWKDSDDPAWLEFLEGWKEMKGDKWEEELAKLNDAELASHLKAMPSYINTTDWLKKDPENMRKYLKEVITNPESPEDAIRYAKKYIDDEGNWKGNNVPTYAQVFGENGRGVRETHPGTYWHSVVEANRNNLAKNWVINDDDTIDEIVGEVPSNWTRVNDYSWATPENDYVYNYYRRPALARTPAGDIVDVKDIVDDRIAKDGQTAADKIREDLAKKYAPNLEKETSYGLFGPAVGLGLQLAGVGKPDYTEMDKTLANAARNYHLATNKYLGNYLKYQPLDIWYNQAMMDAQARATDRAIMNSGANQGSKEASLLASGLNAQLASGNLFRQAQEYNDALEKQKEEFNRGTDQFNADAFNRLSQFNTSEANRAAQFNNQMALQAAMTKLDNDAGWYNGIYGNISGLFDRINQWEKWKRDHNTVARMWATGLAGSATDKTPVAAPYLKEIASNAEGGKVKRKKGKKRGMFI